jgi:hypothetical protein
MKGIVFTEFLEMVEHKFSADMVDRIIDEADVASGGAYSAVGTYPHGELVALVVKLSEATGVPVPDLVKTFGRHLFGQFVKGYPAFFAGVPSAFAFLERIENHIHVEVRKLYPDAELPTFECTSRGPATLELVYRSSRGFADLAEGLMLGCFDHFGEPTRITREDLSGGNGTAVRFTLVRA